MDYTPLPSLLYRFKPRMPSARLTSANLHDPVLSFVRPVPITLRTSQTIGEAHAAVRAAAARKVLYFYVVDDDDRWRAWCPFATCWRLASTTAWKR